MAVLQLAPRLNFEGARTPANAGTTAYAVKLSYAAVEIILIIYGKGTVPGCFHDKVRTADIYVSVGSIKGLRSNDRTEPQNLLLRWN
jgi:hypothetical protein